MKQVDRIGVGSANGSVQRHAARADGSVSLSASGARTDEWRAVSRSAENDAPARGAGDDDKMEEHDGR